MDRRTEAREISMQAIFQLDILGVGVFEEIRRFITRSSNDGMVRDLATKWTVGVRDNMEACDDMIKAAAIKWQMSRLSFVDKSILRLSVYQLRFCGDIPGSVVINEAIEIAKKYSAEQSPGFVNGVLDAVKKKLESEAE